MNNNDIGSASNTGKFYLYIHIFIYTYIKIAPIS